MTGGMRDDGAQLSPESFVVLAPTGRDGEVLSQLLASAALDAVIDTSGGLLLQAIAEGMGAGAIVTDEGLARIQPGALRAALESQAPWSDFPFIVLVRRGDGRAGVQHPEELNATLLERPLHPVSVISSARAALRARRRQRVAGRHLEERERARAELQQLADTLEAKVAERTMDLAAANDRLTAEIAERERAEARLLHAQKMEAVGQLTGGIAHDFNNLLTAVVGSVDLLLRHTQDERLQRLARNALHAAERGAQLTNQLLAFSRRQRLSPVPLSVNDIISGLGDLIARTIGPHVRVETRLQPDMWMALADPTQFEMMLLNLAINARDAMPSGGRLTISTANLETVPPALADELPAGDYVAISVADTGVGMTPAVLARAFEPFFTTKGQGKGTGLGLAQLYGFAKQSGGSVRIESAPGAGTNVTVYLPRTREEGQGFMLRDGRAAASAKARILIVDDDDAVRGVAAAMIEELGYEVTAVASGTEALKLAANESFDLVITDVAMPLMSGVELADRVRKLSPGVQVAFASGYADLEKFGEELSEEVVLKKPFRLADLSAHIDDVLGAVGPKSNVIRLMSASN